MTTAQEITYSGTVKNALTNTPATNVKQALDFLDGNAAFGGALFNMHSTQIADLSARLTTDEATIADHTSRLSTAEADIAALEAGSTADADGLAAEVQARTEADAAQAAVLLDHGTRLGAVEAAAQAEAATRLNADQTETWNRAVADALLGQRIDALTARVTAAEAKLVGKADVKAYNSTTQTYELVTVAPTATIYLTKKGDPLPPSGGVNVRID